MRNIFLADDDIDDTNLFKEAVSELYPRATVICSKDGYSLLDNLNSTIWPVPDIIFLDINMPLLNGFGSIRRIRAEEKYNEVPVIIYSTTGSRADIEKMYEAGADLFVIKPMSYDGIKRTLHTVLGMLDKDATYRRTPENFIFKD